MSVTGMLVQEVALAALQTGLRSSDQDLVLVSLHLVGMVSQLQPECRSGMSTMLADDLRALARARSSIQGAASYILQGILASENAM